MNGFYIRSGHVLQIHLFMIPLTSYTYYQARQKLYTVIELQPINIKKKNMDCRNIRANGWLMGDPINQ